MSYVRRVLVPGETLVYETGLHWLAYLRAAFLLLIAVAIALAGWTVPWVQEDGQRSLIVLAVAGLVLLLAILSALAAAIRRATTELAVTDQRVIFKQGIFGRHTIEMNRSKVESVDVDQSILGRIFGYGTVRLRGTGGSLEPLQAISDPLTLRSYITADAVRHGEA